jgi:general nucleoside transport system ATP-binding protein
MELRSGEILGVAGVAGNGQAELSRVVAGIQRPDEGVVTLEGEALASGGPRAFIKRGVAFIPEDRRGTGLMPTEPIWRNAILKAYREPPISHGQLVHTRRARRFARELASAIGLSTDDVETPVDYLSGGNAQKLVTGRELRGNRCALIADNPTQGLDVGAATDVSRALLGARDDGIAVLLISYDLDELLRLCDRIAVLYEGKVVGEFAADDADRNEIGLLMAGVVDDTGRTRSDGS